MQTDPAPTVAQVLAGTAYTNGTLVTPAANGTIELPAALTDGTDTVMNVDMASAYHVYLVGQDNYTIPNTMVNVSRSGFCCALSILSRSFSCLHLLHTRAGNSQHCIPCVSNAACLLGGAMWSSVEYVTKRAQKVCQRSVLLHSAQACKQK